jgi:hypothetical protein
MQLNGYEEIESVQNAIQLPTHQFLGFLDPVSQGIEVQNSF